MLTVEQLKYMSAGDIEAYLTPIVAQTQELWDAKLKDPCKSAAHARFLEHTIFPLTQVLLDHFAPVLPQEVVDEGRVHGAYLNAQAISIQMTKPGLHFGVRFEDLILEMNLREDLQSELGMKG